MQYYLVMIINLSWENSNLIAKICWLFSVGIWIRSLSIKGFNQRSVKCQNEFLDSLSRQYSFVSNRRRVFGSSPIRYLECPITFNSLVGGHTSCWLVYIRLEHHGFRDLYNTNLWFFVQYFLKARSKRRFDG